MGFYLSTSRNSADFAGVIVPETAQDGPTERFCVKTAQEELAKLPKEAQRKIMKKVEGLKDDPRPAVVKQLKSPEKLLRLRVGDYRVIYLVEGKHLVVLSSVSGPGRMSMTDWRCLPVGSRSGGAPERSASASK